MSALPKSYLTVQYDLRPAKQVERRMLVDAFQLLQEAGFRIRTYQYTGMGSIHFTDFILFHKYLGIRKLLSVEASDEISKRVTFNKPFSLTHLAISKIGSEIPNLRKEDMHILWLDYDSRITDEFLGDLTLATSHLSVGSLVLATFDIEPPGAKGDGPEKWQEYFQEHASPYLDPIMSRVDFAKSKLPKLVTRIVHKAFQNGLQGRKNTTFELLFNFQYADGHSMLTVGGMIATEKESDKIRQSGLKETSYYRSRIDEPPARIQVPKLTRKERLYLEGFMPCTKNWTPKEFELTEEEVQMYCEVYRFIPSYAELLL